MHDIEAIYTEYSNMIYKYLVCLTHDSDLSEELTQETFYIAVKEINKFKGECKVSSWLCQIAKHLCYKELKKKKLEPYSIEDIEIMDSKEGPEEKFLNKQQKENLKGKIKLLDEQSRKIIYLRISGEFSFKEIGEFFGRSEVWARVNFYRSKEKLKEDESYERL